MTTASSTLPDRSDRGVFAAIATLTGVLGVLSLADGVWRTIALAVGNGPVELLAGGDVAGNVGVVSTATVASAAVGDLPRLLLVIASALSTLIAAAIYIAIVAFLVSTVRGTPFHRRLFPVVLVTGALMSIGGILAGGLDGLARMMAGGDLGEPYQPAFELAVGPWAFGFVVLVAAYVIRVGERLQRDAEGLV